MEKENADVLKIRLEGNPLGVSQVSKSLKSVFQVVEESHDLTFRNAGKKVRRYLVALVKRNE